MPHDRIMLAHGGGGLLTGELVREVFHSAFGNAHLARLEDSAVVEVGGKRLCFTTDSYVVSPIFFPGGDIGSLAVNGTVNDLAMGGGTPLFLSTGFILEEGFPTADLVRIAGSIASAADAAAVEVVAGDTKVVPRGAADGVFINTSGIGVVEYGAVISPESVAPGDAVLVNGTVGDHGTAILCVREGLGLESTIVSDSAPLNHLVREILETSPAIHCMRDATRGGLGTILAEIAERSGKIISIEESALPVREEVRGACEILGLDPLFLANEGKMVVFCPAREARKVLDVMRGHPAGRDAALIGHVEETGQGRLLMNTVIGGTREIDMPSGELVPRIC